MKRDVGFFEVLAWGKMESKTRGRSAITRQREGLQLNANGGWNLPDLNLGMPRKMDYLWDTMIRNTLWLSHSLVWSVLKKFHDRFEQNMKNSLRETRHTRPHDISEVTATYEYSMRIWVDETKKIYMKTQSPDGPQSFDEVFTCCTEEEDYTIGGLFLRMTPRVASAASAEDRRRPYEEPISRRVRARGRGRGRGGEGQGKGRGRGRGRGRSSTSRSQCNLWGDRIWSGAASPAANAAAQWHEPAPQTSQERASGKGKGDRKGKKGKGKQKGGSGKGEGKGVCVTSGKNQERAHVPTANSPTPVDTLPRPAQASSRAGSSRPYLLDPHPGGHHSPPHGSSGGSPADRHPSVGQTPPNGVFATPVGGHTDDGVVPHPALALAAYLVPGLECADVAPALAAQALRELQAANFGGSPSHQHLEIGLPFYATSTQTVIDKYPAIKAIITEAHKALRHSAPHWQDINVICRWYTNGGQLRAHVDKVEQFTDTVYTSVLQTTCAQSLTMFPPKDLPQTRSFPLEEAPGRVFSFSGKARYDWEHGVPVLTKGERVSVSWRFFLDNKSQEIDEPRPAKVPRLSLRAPPGPAHVVLSFCDGIGAVPLAANRIWPGKVVTFTWEILPHATKVAQHHIPRYHHHGDLRNITDQLLVHILQLVHVIVVVAAGFPCQDNSTLRSQRLGLRGQKTGLFYDIASILDSLRLLHAFLKLSFPIYTLWENVRGTSEEDSQVMMELTKCHSPVLLDAEECSDARRPRKFWPNWTVQTRPWEHWTLKGPCDHLQNWASRPKHTAVGRHRVRLLRR